MFARSLIFIGLLLCWLGLSQLALAKDPPKRPPTPTPEGLAPAGAQTATPDRLAPPPTVENPSQADEGAQIYWLHCQPCHGDQGQGLTDEWRAQYPPDHQNCWTSGCHGDNPYENGFTLPTQVPAVIGEGSLSRFEHMGQVHEFVQSAMPYQAPSNLTDEEYLAITAFLARSHGVWEGAALDESTVAQLSLQGAGGETQAAGETLWVAGSAMVVVVVGVALLGGIWMWRRRL